jgi:hypothetical protein
MVADRGRAEARRAPGEAARRAWTDDEVALLRRRTAIRSSANVVNAGVTLWLLSQGEWLRVGLVVLASVLLFLQTTAWARDPNVRLRDALVGIAADSVSLLVAASAWVAPS